MKSKALFVTLACTLVACGAGTAPTTVVASSFVPGPCPSPPQPIPELRTARCGRLTVPEDRRHPNGKKIVLSVAIIPAASPQRKSDPIVWIAGGPGDDAITEIPAGAGWKAQSESRRDLHIAARHLYRRSETDLRFGGSLACRNAEHAVRRSSDRKCVRRCNAQVSPGSSGADRRPRGVQHAGECRRSRRSAGCTARCEMEYLRDLLRNRSGAHVHAPASERHPFGRH